MTSLLIPAPPPPRAAVDLPAALPTQDDLPCDDGMPMETLRHKLQMDLLIDALDAWLEARGNGFAGGNMFLYYSLEQVRRQAFIGPDFFVALDVPRGERKSWVVWGEGKTPDVVVELLSPSTAQYDKTAKKALYAREVRVPEYYWYDPFDPGDFAGFVLDGGGYRPLTADARSRILSPTLQLCLGCWEGVYKGVKAVWLRWFTPDGAMLPTEAEIAWQQAEIAQYRAETAEQRAETAEQRVEMAEQRAARLAERLRQLGVNPDTM